ncbi:MAG: hypothetical protein ACFB9N_19200 [Geitlerinemataceae cyanobacterium]
MTSAAFPMWGELEGDQTQTPSKIYTGFSSADIPTSENTGFDIFSRAEWEETDFLDGRVWTRKILKVDLVPHWENQECTPKFVTDELSYLGWKIHCFCFRSVGNCYCPELRVSVSLDHPLWGRLADGRDIDELIVTIYGFRVVNHPGISEPVVATESVARSLCGERC